MNATPLVAGKFITIEKALKTFGKQIKLIRKQKGGGNTQEELSKHCDVSLTVIKRLESGKPISTKNLMKILSSLQKLHLLIDLYKQPEISPIEIWESEKRKNKLK